MPFCTVCGKSATTRGNNRRTIDPVTNKCNECTSKSTSNSDGMNEYYEANRQKEQGDVGDDLEPLSAEMMGKAVSDLTVKDILEINLHSNKPIAKKLDDFIGQVNDKMTKLDKRIELLEAENTKKEEDNITLKEIIRNMQKSLNKIDSGTRDKNIIITGLPEENVSLDNQTIEGDVEKVRWILEYTKNRKFSHESINNLDITRIGEPKPEYNRVVKIRLDSIEDRNNFLENTQTLKNAPDPWSKVYIKKDQHPTYVGENNRLRKKMKILKSNPDNKNKDIKITKGKLFVDGRKVDENTFFH